MRLLIVEDDPKMGRILVQGLGEAGHECRWAQDGAHALEFAKKEDFDVIVLDLLLPVRNGLEVLRRLRGAGSEVPVLVVTALGTVEERISGLEAGADDYLIKPFSFAELKARINAVHRRAQKAGASVLTAGGLQLDIDSRRVSRSGEVIDLTPTQFSLLEFLMRYAGQVVTRKMLCEHLWEADWEGETNIVDVHINHLRNKIDKVPGKSIITTVRGRGYCLLDR